MHSFNKLVPSLIALLAFGCDSLEPAKPADGGVATGDGGTQVTNSMIPAGAVAVEGTFAGDPGFFAWATVDGAGALSTFAFSIPVSTIRKAAGAQIYQPLPLPQPVLDQTPFKSFSLMYLPTGHIPAGVYDVPHWEWHLNLESQEYVDGIDCSDNAVPPKSSIPPNTTVLPICLPKLGMHGLPLSMPEFNGQRFIYGTYGAYYKSQFLAVEPKVLSSLLQEQPHFTMPSFDPTPLGAAGKYPKSWKVDYNADQNQVVFTASEWITK